MSSTASIRASVGPPAPMRSRLRCSCVLELSRESGTTATCRVLRGGPRRRHVASRPRFALRAGRSTASVAEPGPARDELNVHRQSHGRHGATARIARAMAAMPSGARSGQRTGDCPPWSGRCVSGRPQGWPGYVYKPMQINELHACHRVRCGTRGFVFRLQPPRMFRAGSDQRPRGCHRHAAECAAMTQRAEPAPRAVYDRGSAGGGGSVVINSS